MNIPVQPRKVNISRKKLGVVASASFDTLIAAIKDKSEKAQVTFLHRLFEEVDGEVLAMAQRYSELEIKKRARNVKTDTDFTRDNNQSSGGM